MHSAIKQSLHWSRRVVIMVKAPVAGRVKTRLAADIGTVSATGFYRTLVRNIITRISMDRRWKTLIAVAPDTDISSPFWPSAVPSIRQGAGDLGERMQRVMNSLPPGPVIIIGTDIPEISPAHISAAFRALGNSDAVFGPAGDGGYWLVGLKRTPRVLSAFNNVRWSGEHTLHDTLLNLAEKNVARTIQLKDVDTGVEYRELKTVASRLVIPVGGNVFSTFPPGKLV